MTADVTGIVVVLSRRKARAAPVSVAVIAAVLFRIASLLVDVVKFAPRPLGLTGMGGVDGNASGVLGLRVVPSADCAAGVDVGVLGVPAREGSLLIDTDLSTTICMLVICYI